MNIAIQNECDRLKIFMQFNKIFLQKLANISVKIYFGFQ